MFASQVASYNDQPLLGTRATTATDNYEAAHPLYQLIAKLAGLRRANPALLHGRQIVRSSGAAPGLFAVSRIDPVSGREILVAFNTSTSALDAHVLVDARSSHFDALFGNCSAGADAPGSYHVRLDALDFLICAASAAP